MPIGDSVPPPRPPRSPDVMFHQMPWTDFDELSRGEIRPEVVQRLRSAERSRRLLLLRGVVDAASKKPEVFTPLPSPEDAWDLLARVEASCPDAFDFVLAHPYVGSWVGYTVRLLQKGITGVCPLWMHVGHVHAVAAAAAIRADLNFQIQIPVWEGGAILPTLGMARLPTVEAHTLARVRGSRGQVEIANDECRVIVTRPFDVDNPRWWTIHKATATTDGHSLTVRIDDVDPYRGLHEPLLPRRLDVPELEAWRDELTRSWHLIAQYLPDLIDAFRAGIDSIVPGPETRLRSFSASTGEAFGSALIARPNDASTLAATLVHEFYHIVLGGVLHLAQLHEDDPHERFYVPWRHDPRPLGGAFQGIYAFFGITAFWRAVMHTEDENLARRAMFEFAQARNDSWRVLDILRHDLNLTVAGRRFVSGIAETLKPWLAEPVTESLQRLAAAITADHHARYRMRHLRPDRHAVSALAEAWLAGQARPPIAWTYTEPTPTPVPDGSSSEARANLVRMDLVLGDRRALQSEWRSVPDATSADLAYVSGRYADAVRGYRAELAREPDRVSAWVGLGLALAEIGTGPAVRALTHYPELVRAVRRQIAVGSSDVPTPERIATWLGQTIY